MFSLLLLGTHFLFLLYDLCNEWCFKSMNYASTKSLRPDFTLLNFLFTILRQFVFLFLFLAQKHVVRRNKE